ncbi:hypothetical protein FRB95_002500 [Tulasnella sp. JGI-2019a]|nr:hypothetical protein FRB95_002500 [Tulasnella sp. JGI-2019a]
MSDISSPTPLEVLEFRGGPTEDVSSFLGAIKRAAVIQGRHSDDRWMVSYAESCLRGDAMTWFDELGPEIATDWRSFRKALLHRFQRPDSHRANSPPLAPAAAPPPAAAPRRLSISSVPATQPVTTAPQVLVITPMSRCRVRVIKGNGVVLGYVAPPARSGWCFIVTSTEQALVLDIPTLLDTNQTGARIKMAAHSEVYPFLGLEQYNSEHWYLRACEAGPEGNVFKGLAQADTTHETWPASSKVWTVKALGESIEELCAQWISDTGAQVPLHCVAWSGQVCLAKTVWTWLETPVVCS